VVAADADVADHELAGLATGREDGRGTSGMPRPTGIAMPPVSPGDAMVLVALV
jgi:hypothetical protein